MKRKNQKVDVEKKWDLPAGGERRNSGGKEKIRKRI
jgi:hypothetical protein